ncbi:MAG: MOSC domain-containing protein [Cyanobacteria bacterium]|nr:MOSC domain-containing protein [Cyanobacteriota bacterium]
MNGQIFQISVSPGGVPKTAIAQSTVTATGLAEDQQQTPGIHGGPERAVCLWSLEIIQQLQREGHSALAPGCAGENVTLTGLDWSWVVPGVKVQLGATVMLQVASYAAPCRKNMHWFSDRRYSRISHKHHPGCSRVYARVLQPGVITAGDAARLVVG